MPEPITVQPDIAILYAAVEQAMQSAGDSIDAKTAIIAALADLTGYAAYSLAQTDAKKLNKAIDIASNYMAKGAMGRHMRARITLNGEPGNGEDSGGAEA